MLFSNVSRLVSPFGGDQETTISVPTLTVPELRLQELTSRVMRNTYRDLQGY
ncbi:MAG: hypothetical protein RIS36_1687, partial [Pseudomonadota bacterium]